MFDHSIQRLFWKELRTQWHIWAALLVGAFLLQLLYLLPLRGMPMAPDYPFYVGLVLTACYAVTCGAVLFAGEREEQTDDWLRQLPMTSRGLMAGKLTFLLLSLAAFAVAVSVAALLLNRMTHLGATSTRLFWSDLREQSLVFLLAIAGMTAWSVFYSLILNRVMAVLAASVATYLVSAAIVDNLLPGSFEAWMTGATVLVAVVDLWLGKRWLAGRSSQPMQGARARLEGDRMATGAGSEFWLTSVRRAAVMTPLGMRTVAVLLWRELRSAVPFAVAWSLGGVLMVDLLCRTGMEGMNYLWFILTPLLCGLMTCTGDNTRQTFRFLADRGLSPVTVWITKHGVWLLLAIGLVVVFGWYDQSTALAGFSQPELSRRAPRAFDVFTGLARVPGAAEVPHFEVESQWRAISGIASLILALYFLGHVCSLWLRRIVVAMSVAGLCGVLLVGWTIASLRLDVPPLLTLWPLVLAGIAASVLTVSGWLHERSSWKRILAQAAWVVVPVLIVGSSAMAYRATQIPVVTLPFNWEAKTKEMERTNPQWERDWQQTFDDLRSLSSSSRPPSMIPVGNDTDFEASSVDGEADAATNAVSRAAEMAANRARSAGGGASEDGQPDTAGESPDAGFFPPGAGLGSDPADRTSGDNGAFDEMPGMSGMMGMAIEPAVSPWETLLDNTTSSGALVERLVDMADRLQNRTPAIGLRNLTVPNQPIVTLGHVIVAAADAHRQCGELDEAWRVLQAGLTLTAYLPHEVIFPYQLQACWDARGSIQQGIQSWAADPAQTVERLRKAQEFFAGKGIRGVVSAVPMWENQYSIWRQAIEQPESEASRRLGGYVWADEESWWPPVSEKERLIRLMGVLTASQITPNEQLIGRDAEGTATGPITPADIQRWDATTFPIPYEPGSDATLNIKPVAAAEMATPLIIRLHIYRHEHGAFPETLDDLREDGGGEIPRDPATGLMFGYAPRGFEVPVLVAMERGPNSAFTVSPDLPLLWSPGTDQPVPVLDGQLIAMSTVSHVDPGELAAVKAMADQMYSGRDETARENLQNQLMFINVGHAPW